MHMMLEPPAGISEADWSSWLAGARQLILAQQQEIDQLRNQLTALATELASLRERIGRSSRNSSKPPSSDGPGFKPPERRKGSGRKRGGQLGHPGSGPESLPIERVDEVGGAPPRCLPPLRHAAGWRRSRPIAPSGG